MFERPHHRRMGRVLMALDASLLRAHQCWFGGGTAIALRHGEYRESRDIDLLVSDTAGYRELRQHLRGARDLGPLTRPGAETFAFEREIRIDQYGIRGFVLVNRVAIDFEILHEGRIGFEVPPRTNQTCGVATLTLIDLAASKLLANADRWRDESVFARDTLDLAMLSAPAAAIAPGIGQGDAGLWSRRARRPAPRAARIARAPRLARALHAIAGDRPRPGRNAPTLAPLEQRLVAAAAQPIGQPNPL